MLTAGADSDTMLVKKSGFLVCPRCGNRKLLRVTPSTEARALPVWCRKCQTEITVDISRGQCQLSRSPERSRGD